MELNESDGQGNLSVETQRMLRNILPSNTLWQSFRDGREFYSTEETLKRLADIFETTEDDSAETRTRLPPAIGSMLDIPVAMEALGGMMYYLKSLNLDKDLMSQQNFNIYDPIREGKSLVLDGVTLGHMEVGQQIFQLILELIARSWSITREALKAPCWSCCRGVRHLLVSSN